MFAAKLKRSKMFENIAVTYISPCPLVWRKLPQSKAGKRDCSHHGLNCKGYFVKEDGGFFRPALGPVLCFRNSKERATK